MDIQKIIDSLSPNERAIIPHLKEKELNSICKKSNLDRVSVLRALEYLRDKKIIQLLEEKKEVVSLGVNGALYKKKGLPERRLLALLHEKRIVPLDQAEKLAELSTEEFRASLGALKKKAMIELQNGKIVLSASKEEIAKRSLEEQFIELLPISLESISAEQKYALKLLQDRRDIIRIEKQTTYTINPTEIGKTLMNARIESGNLIEQITPELLKKDDLWKGKKFRRYDVAAPVPRLNGGKEHFVNQSIDYARTVWTEMGFKEMTGPTVLESFWVFDALFTAQDHPAREMQDTFFIDRSGKLPDKKMVAKVKEAHEKGLDQSSGWQYQWEEKEAKKMVLRTHTTALSALQLAKTNIDELPQKWFAIGKCFRNETTDWSHGFEFNQTEGIVIDPNANFRHLLGYLTQFFKKMGYEKIRFRPSFFAYTEPSVEIDVWHPERKIWFELGGAGIFRPEVTIPLLGKHIPVLAWGPGFDRILMNFYELKDIRELYKNDIKFSRELKMWRK